MADPSLLSTLITANHILHAHSTVDAYGHISTRNPADPSTFIMSGDRAPALVSSPADLIEYRVSDASAVDANAGRGYAERYIHSEIYKMYPEVMAVVHAHPEEVIPYGVTDVPLRPVYHMAGVCGPRIPVFDITLHYPSTTSSGSHPHSLLVTTAALGLALARAFNPPPAMLTKLFAYLRSSTSAAVSSSSSSSSAQTQAPQAETFPPHTTVLMRAHGMTCIGRSIESAVYTAVYACANARIQTRSLALQASFDARNIFAGLEGLARRGLQQGGGGLGIGAGEGVRYLDERECGDAWGALGGTVGRAWGLWEREVRVGGLYRNEMLGEAGE